MPKLFTNILLRLYVSEIELKLTAKESLKLYFCC